MKIQLDLSSPKPFSKHFLFGIGSGHAPLLLRKDAVEQLKFIHDTLGIQQVRFHGIFNDDMNVVRSLQDVLPLPGAESSSTSALKGSEKFTIMSWKQG